MWCTHSWVYFCGVPLEFSVFVQVWNFTFSDLVWFWYVSFTKFQLLPFSQTSQVFLKKKTRRAVHFLANPNNALIILPLTLSYYFSCLQVHYLYSRAALEFEMLPNHQLWPLQSILGFSTSFNDGYWEVLNVFRS